MREWFVQWLIKVALFCHRRYGCSPFVEIYPVPTSSLPYPWPVSNSAMLHIIPSSKRQAVFKLRPLVHDWCMNVFSAWYWPAVVGVLVKPSKTGCSLPWCLETHAAVQLLFQDKVHIERNPFLQAGESPIEHGGSGGWVRRTHCGARWSGSPKPSIERPFKAACPLPVIAGSWSGAAVALALTFWITWSQNKFVMNDRSVPRRVYCCTACVGFFNAREALRGKGAT